MPGYALDVRALTKRIGNRAIVEDVSFHVEKGEIFGLLGPNGAGKTTIIRMIVSLIKRSSGSVMINGHDLDEDFVRAMNEVGAIVENPEFYAYLSGRKNLRHYGRMALANVGEERMKEVIELVGLEEAIEDKVATYSLGMRQRLGVAQAILHKPSLLILDEPTNGLDPQGIREIRDYLKKLASEGTSVLVSSHLLSEMQLMCDRFAIIDKGKMVQILTLNEEPDSEAYPVEFEVSSADRAAEAIIGRYPDLNVKRIHEHRISFEAKRGDVAELNALLVNNQIQVYEITPMRATLEDRFLELTNREKKESSV